MSDEPPIQPENDEPASEDGVPEDLVVPVELVDFSGEGIEPIEIQAEMEQSFLDYAMSVIVSRALPDVRDGLKPVHRRILWAMHEAGLRPDRQHRKCATVVGDVIGKYHPHGDSSVYDALVRMGQDFSLSHVLIDKHGNFGSLSDGRPPTATPSAASIRSPCRCWPRSTRTPSTGSPTTMGRPKSPPCCRRGSPTFWLTARRASQWAWPPTSRRTTWAR